MFIALTGTPGTGKTTVSELLLKRGFNTITVEELAIKHGCLEESEDGKVVDVERLASLVKQPDAVTILDGHLSHFLPSQMIIVLRLNPNVIYNRLYNRGYDVDKIMDNKEAEAVDIILAEAMEQGAPVFEIDTTKLHQVDVADIVERIIKGEGDDYAPGKVDWGQVVMDWY